MNQQNEMKASKYLNIIFQLVREELLELVGEVFALIDDSRASDHWNSSNSLF